VVNLEGSSWIPRNRGNIEAANGVYYFAFLLHLTGVTTDRRRRSNEVADVSNERVHLVGYRFTRLQFCTLRNMGTWLI
jgi:hypothetical protein